MTPSELKSHLSSNEDENHHFDKATLKFFGDTMSNYGVRKVVVPIGDYSDGIMSHIVDAWELYRKRPVKHGLRGSAFFACSDFRRLDVAAKEVA